MSVIAVQTGAAPQVAPTIPDNVTISRDGKAEIANPNANRPAWLPEKFKSAEDMAKAYSESEKTLTRQAQELADLKKGAQPVTKKEEGTSTPQTPPVTPTTPDPAKPETPITLGLQDLNALSTEYASNAGKLTDESLAKLAKAGISKEVVDHFIKGQEALAAQHGASLEAVVGGKDSYTKLTEWYAANGDPGARNEYNKALSTGNYDGAKLLLRGMNAEYEAKVGKDARLTITGSETAGNTTAATFASWPEVHAAMNDTKYKTDPAYRKMVENKLMNSKI